MFLLIALFLGVIIFFSLIYLNTSPNTANTDARARLLFERHNILDCDAIKLPCMVDEQCSENCKSGITMRCENGFCATRPRYSANHEDCDVSRGLIMVVTALDGFAVENVCVSMYRDVVEDGGELRPYVCENGVMNLDLENGPFAVEDCTCNSGFTRFTYTSGAFSRPIPVCIDNASAVLFARVYK
ncbi:PIF-3 [Epinotia aporema granulovirus]|uniref:PIF-3 n=1 Tax=Epinotia aporema granulovirus TaxID=166056 RepID=K4ER57_9BBAC|nr:PIF-3 [Epinotia aporema granulovirus]AER41464.1 PIF-3 [Epinotia aporema granulovirus]